MLNFKELKLDKRIDNSTDPFVGIRKNANGEPEFRLPIGFDNFPEDDFNETKQLFFRMYRTFKKFEKDNLGKFHTEKSTDRDNIEINGKAYQFKDKEGNDVILYSKISVIENILEAYQDLALDVIERRIGRNENIDFSKIDRYLHKAVYLEDDIIYIEAMDLARQTLQYKGANIVELFCFIVSELQQELEQTNDGRVNELANKFREQHLTHDQSLFNEETFETAIFSLKEILDDIDKITAYKDDDYWRLYEAIETFLYGELDMENTHEDGIFWGINCFWPIWEDMCNTYAFKTFKDVVYADTNVVVNGKRVANNSTPDRHQIFCKEDFKNEKNPFFVEFQGEKRWMRPDFIRINDKKIIGNKIIIKKEETRISGKINIIVNLSDKEAEKTFKTFISKLKQHTNNRTKKYSKSEYKFTNYSSKLLNDEIEYIERGRIKTVLILDWKYHDANSCKSYNKKIQRDIIKQLSYEFALQQSYPDFFIESQFVIPYFYPSIYDDIGDFIEDKLLVDNLKNNGIKVFQANFMKIQQIYLAEL
ncbi:MAG: hypothetical protein QM487_02185 [Candidatus Marithrix sp.]